MESDDDRPSVPTLPASTHLSLRVVNSSEICEKEAARLRGHDDASSSSSQDSSQASKTTSGSATARASQDPDWSTEWMFHGIVAFPCPSEFTSVDWNRITVDDSEIRQEFKKIIGECVEADFSRRAPVTIEHIVIVSDIAEVTTADNDEEDGEEDQQKLLVLPVRGYVAATVRAHRKTWEDSIHLGDRHGLTWTAVTGGIRCWPLFNYDRDNVNDPDSTVDVLAMWGTRSYFNAHGKAWMFTGSLEVPPRTAEDCDILQLAREAFNAAARLPDARPSGLNFLAVHCEIAELMSADDANGVRIGVRGFLQSKLSKSYKWETWLPHPWEWRPLRGGLGGNEEFESASTEVKTESSGWVEIIVDGKLGKNNALRTAVAQQARAARSSASSSGAVSSPHPLSNFHLFDRPAPHTSYACGPRRMRNSAHSPELPSLRQARAASASSSSATKSSSSTDVGAGGSDGGVKRRRKGPGSASSPSVASAQERRRQRPEAVSSIINCYPRPASARASGLLHSHTLY